MDYEVINNNTFFLCFFLNKDFISREKLFQGLFGMSQDPNKCNLCKTPHYSGTPPLQKNPFKIKTKRLTSFAF